MLPLNFPQVLEQKLVDSPHTWIGGRTAASDAVLANVDGVTLAQVGQLWETIE